ncbi:hypothetical protein ELQ90_12225 [Labedella phragmitis]|uniref:Uncharacterized protein n=1 Tax=Labedella phragmitis TaxID=2498849 RepID=A0A3S3ZMT6_9MICO|nr:hypothetical protein [Labedella phragmitis]RWZ49531.1 hypothetical protein ELQ90_12225 [Labedella phragmitis]
MAWSNSYPEARQNGSGEPINYYTWRNMKGQVQFRFTDIEVDGGAQWYSAYGWINLIDNTGKVWADKAVHKSWGVTPAFTNLCFIPGNRLVRMQVTMHVINRAGAGYYNHWTSHLRWNNSTAV